MTHANTSRQDVVLCAGGCVTLLLWQLESERRETEQLEAELLATRNDITSAFAGHQSGTASAQRQLQQSRDALAQSKGRCVALQVPGHPASGASFLIFFSHLHSLPSPHTRHVARVSPIRNDDNVDVTRRKLCNWRRRFLPSRLPS